MEGLNMKCKTTYEQDHYSQHLFIERFLKVFGKDYTHHAKIAKELKKRNDDIYRTLMVGVLHSSDVMITFKIRTTDYK